MTCDVIATGSTGNAVLLDGKILIDCGVPWSKIAPYYRGIAFCLLTHIHSDHFCMATIRRLHVERPSVRFVCGKWLAQPLLSAGINPLVLDVLDLDEAAYYTDGTAFRLFGLVHDVDNAGYKIRTAAGERAIYATDTGSMDGVVARGYELYMIEANHREDEIRQRVASKIAAGEYCYEYRAQYNHLSAEKANAWLAENATPDYSSVVFLHQHVERSV